MRDVQEIFGFEVAEIVRGCSDFIASDSETNSKIMEKPTWRDRKLKYIESVAIKSRSICLVSCADKLHNASDILRDSRNLGVTQAFAAFKGGIEGTLWYYESLVDAFRKTDVPQAMIDDLDRVVTELVALSRTV